MATWRGVNFDGGSTHFVAKDIESFSDSLHLFALSSSGLLGLGGGSLSLSWLFVLLGLGLANSATLVAVALSVKGVVLAAVSAEEIDGGVATGSGVDFDGGSADLVSEDIKGLGHVGVLHLVYFFYLN